MVRRLLPAVLTIAVVTIVGIASETPAWAMAWYFLCFLWLIVLPGLLARRVLLGRAEDWIEQLSMGAAVGLLLLLPVWALLTAVGANQLLIAWPLVAIAPFVASPRLRSALLPGTPLGRVPELAQWVLALAATAVILVWGTGFAAGTQLPPGPFAWYPDDYWQLALAAELGQRVPPDVPQVTGGPFMYHWFANANMFTMSKASGLDLVLVYARLWEPPMRLLAIGLAFVLSRRLSGSATAGSVAAILLAVGTQLRVSWFSLPGSGVLNLHSPSQLFGVIMLLVVLLLLVDLLGGRRDRGHLALLVGSALSSVGAKASIPPVILTGTGLVWLRAITSRWIGPVDTTLRRASAAFGLGVATVIAGLVFAAGGAAGVSVQLFAGVRLSEPWRLFTGKNEDLSGATLMPGLAGSRDGVIVLLLVLLHFVVSYAWLATAWPLLRRGAAAAWLLLGVGLGGLLAMLLLDQDGGSQVYFMMGGLAAWQALAIWGLHDCVARAKTQFAPEAVLRSGLVGGALGVVLATVLAKFAGRAPTSAAVAGNLAGSLGEVLLIAALAVAAAWFLRSRAPVGVAAASLVLSAATVPRLIDALHLYPSERLVLLAALLLALIALLPPLAVRPVLAAGAALLVAHAALTIAPAVQPRQIPATARGAVTTNEYEALRWLSKNTPRDDIIATNVHCSGTRTVPHCDVRAFWVTAFGQRRALIESWAYTKQAHAMQGEGGLRSTRQPFHDQALYQTNERAFTAPTEAGLNSLKSLGVKWLVADTKAGPVSPTLARLAHPAYNSGTLTIYQLR